MDRASVVASSSATTALICLCFTVAAWNAEHQVYQTVEELCNAFSNLMCCLEGIQPFVYSVPYLMDAYMRLFLLWAKVFVRMLMVIELSGSDNDDELENHAMLLFLGKTLLYETFDSLDD
ncbi:hypothetical protein SPRG_11597 [Saprolegnia parasitica CBS 223.65]|uniref:Uncharacterized protein n=1 Tax=Saprolegnia parasitica (strain CBS 223.65) TaxID=695850 RepID=A0A067BYF1_SAPPC|nr:hypothetical protein SPRG_11597 [Saprolegnia parasitica CBS 223.65]KDO23283.1 hypothetical protein SPRG_11597 [Saprolegnia parasitica CBS 223.65]|eukprot:XP_012205937.1 hypothetical protein SPRG_11597 [Saprolegnia parasitica CBS 223.65]